MTDNDSDDDQNKPMSKKTVLGGMLIVLALLVYMMVKSIQNLPTDNPAHAVALNTPQNAPEGNVQQVAIGFPVSGRITQMFFAQGAEVKQGDILASLDRAPFEEALASAKAQLQVAEADYNKSIHIPTSNFNAIEAARANVETAQHVYDEARTELEKRRGMMVAGQLDNVYTDDVQNEHDAELDLERARRELAQQEDAAGNRADRDQYKAAIEAAQANVAVAQTNLANTQLSAPAAGTIISRASEIGATTPAGATVYVLSIPRTTASNP